MYVLSRLVRMVMSIQDRLTEDKRQLTKNNIEKSWEDEFWSYQKAFPSQWKEPWSSFNIFTVLRTLLFGSDEVMWNTAEYLL